MGKVTVELQTFDEWLAANAHFGAQKLATATGAVGAAATPQTRIVTVSVLEHSRN